MSAYRQELGRSGEEAAARFLEGLGCVVLERSFRCRMGELDLVVRDGDTLVFVEVKARSSERFGGGAAAVDARKQAHIARAALAYLALRGVGDVPVRFDVVALRDGRVSHLKDAFQAGGFTR